LAVLIRFIFRHFKRETGHKQRITACLTIHPPGFATHQPGFEVMSLSVKVHTVHQCNSLLNNSTQLLEP